MKKEIQPAETILKLYRKDRSKPSHLISSTSQRAQLPWHMWLECVGGGSEKWYLKPDHVYNFYKAPPR